jgi:hypothetical protein
MERCETFEQALLNWRANRPMQASELAEVCPAQAICFEYNAWVRCGPCALRTPPHPGGDND